MLNIAMTNAFLLAQRTHAPYKDLRAFKLKLFEQLMMRANPKRKRPQDPREHEALCASSSRIGFKLIKASKQAVCIVCKAKGQDAKRRKPLSERSVNSTTTHFRVARSTWSCSLCYKTLCRNQQCIDAHLRK